MLYARTNAEAHLYMDLHPCACGEPAFDRTSVLVERGDALASIYEGTCPACGSARLFEFLLPDALPKPGILFGSDEPSQIICPGEFLAYSDQLARRIPASPSGLDPAARSEARRVLERAIAALDEVMKFIPSGQDLVPVGSFRSPAGKEAYLAEPGRLSRGRLGAVREAYAEIARRMTA